MPLHVSPSPSRPGQASSPAPPDLCQHHPNCQCQRPQLGRAIVVVVALQMLMACITIASGSSVIGLVACIAMGGCAWMAAVAEVIAFYRIGLDQRPTADLRNVRPVGFRPNQNMP